MYTERQIEQTLEKLKRLEKMLEPHLFEKVDEMEMGSCQMDINCHEVPEKEKFSPCEKGTVYPGEAIYIWFRGTYQVPERLAGKTLYIWPKVQGHEGMLWVDDVPYGNFASKFAGSHYCDLLRKDVRAGETMDIAMEYYSNHYVIGTQPFQKDERADYKTNSQKLVFI